tara:strand:+ start:2259 stop:3461 length:1203 start_codon:yes stop_codon:yes gene_type:complete
MYGILAMPLAFASTPLYIYAPDFYAHHFYLSLSWLGTALLFLRLIDAIQDPIIGLISDRFATYRPRLIYISGLLLVCSFYALFHPVFTNYALNFIVFIFLSTTAFSILSINLNSLGALWGQDDHQKILIVGYRELFGLIGLMLAVSLPQISTDPALAWTITCVILVFLMILSLSCYRYWQSQHHDLNKNKKLSMIGFAQFQQLPTQSLKIFLVYGVSMLASSFPGVLVIFFIRDRLQLEPDTGLFLSVYFVAAVASIPLWKKLSNRLNKERVWLSGMCLSIAFFIWAALLEAGHFWPYLWICLGSGIALGAEVVMPPTLLADVIQKHQCAHQASLLFSILAFLGKLALALAAAIGFSYLDYFLFVPAQENTKEALQALSQVYAVLPCFLKFIAALILYKI